ncbi:MAG: hypothetical protein R3D66_04075 [Alphaproteobacteria bacterium]
MSFPLVRYVLTAALRDRLILSMILLLLLGTSLSVFFGSAAITEKKEFAVVFTGGSLRMLGVAGLVLFTVFFVRRSFETKDIEFLLSRPVGRVRFIFSYAFAISLLAAAMGIATGLSIVALSPLHWSAGNMLWAASIIAENIILVNTALFFSMILSSPSTATLITLAFYVLGRMMGQILGILDSSPTYPVLEYIMQGISMFMPRIDLLGQTSWLLYGLGDGGIGLCFVLFQGAVFTLMVVLAASIDLMRRQF